MPVGQFLVVAEVSPVEETPEGFADQFVVVDFGLFDLLEEGFDVVLVDVIFLVYVQQVVDGVYCWVVVGVAFVAGFVYEVVEGYCDFCQEYLAFGCDEFGKDGFEEGAVLLSADEGQKGLFINGEAHFCEIHEFFEKLFDAELEGELVDCGNFRGDCGNEAVG
jgi:hypothetical protein